MQLAWLTNGCAFSRRCVSHYVGGGEDNFIWTAEKREASCIISGQGEAAVASASAVQAAGVTYCMPIYLSNKVRRCTVSSVKVKWACNCLSLNKLIISSASVVQCKLYQIALYPIAKLGSNRLEWNTCTALYRRTSETTVNLMLLLFLSLSRRVCLTLSLLSFFPPSPSASVHQSRYFHSSLTVNHLRCECTNAIEWVKWKTFVPWTNFIPIIVT